MLSRIRSSLSAVLVATLTSIPGAKCEANNTSTADSPPFEETQLVYGHASRVWSEILIENQSLFNLSSIMEWCEFSTVAEKMNEEAKRALYEGWMQKLNPAETTPSRFAYGLQIVLSLNTGYSIGRRSALDAAEALFPDADFKRDFCVDSMSAADQLLKK